MLIFFVVPNGTLAIPISRFTQIKQVENKIFLSYLTAFEETEETFTVKYSSESAAVDAMNDFFDACANNQGAFLFKAV